MLLLGCPFIIILLNISQFWMWKLPSAVDFSFYVYLFALAYAVQPRGAREEDTTLGVQNRLVRKGCVDGNLWYHCLLVRRFHWTTPRSNWSYIIVWLYLVLLISNLAYPLVCDMKPSLVYFPVVLGFKSKDPIIFKLFPCRIQMPFLMTITKVSTTRWLIPRSTL